jgi:3-hexulose-6-phosphate synthase
MKSPRKPWVQIAIDERDISQALRLTKIALRAGADWIEAGTPLIVYESVRSIKALVDICKDVPVVADFKAQDGVYKYFMEAERQGAKLAVVLGVVADGSVMEAIRAGKDSGIKVVVDLFSVPLADIVQRAKHLEAMGADYLMVHLGFDEGKYDSSRHPFDGLAEVAKAVKIPVGVGTFSIEEGIEAVKLGASWVVMGNPLLSDPDAENKLTGFIKAVKSAV